MTFSLLPYTVRVQRKRRSLLYPLTPPSKRDRVEEADKSSVRRRSRRPRIRRYANQDSGRYDRPAPRHTTGHRPTTVPPSVRRRPGLWPVRRVLTGHRSRLTRGRGRPLKRDNQETKRETPGGEEETGVCSLPKSDLGPFFCLFQIE